MTIFLEVIKAYLVDAVRRIRDSSVAADKSTINVFTQRVTLGAIGRDPLLSEEKQKLADKLLFNLNQFEDQGDDAKNYELLIKLLSDSKVANGVATKKKGYNEGKFGTKMLSILQVLDKIFEKTKEVNLLNIRYDDEPLNVFRYFTVLYYTQKISDSHNINAFTVLAQHPKLTTFAQLSETKEKLVIEILQKCERDLDTLDVKHSEYKNTKKERVVEWLDKLARANTDLCKSYGAALTIPIGIALFSTINIVFPTLQPNSGFLERCIQNAIGKIDPDRQNLLSLNPW